MEIVPASRFIAASVATGIDVAGREYLVVVARSSWQIPQPGQRPQPLPPQPLVEADSRLPHPETGEPEAGGLRCGDDFARYKPRCDVIFDACAHAPQGRPVTELGVGFSIDGQAKVLRVVGARQWQRGLGGYRLSAPEPFVSVPLHYGLAHGGSRNYLDREGRRLSETYADNPEGRGWGGPQTLDQLHGAPAAQLEALEDPIRSPARAHRVAGLGAIARHWPVRLRHAGRMDARWQREVFPFLPEDFDERFHQVAPEDQQIAYPRGGERVRLVNLLAGQPELEFKLPALDMPVRVLRGDFRSERLQAHADTLFFETERRRFSVVWRTQLPILRHVSEFDLVAVGAVDPNWWRQRSLGLDESCVGCGARTDRMPEPA